MMYVIILLHLIDNVMILLHLIDVIILLHFIDAIILLHFIFIISRQSLVYIYPCHLKPYHFAIIREQYLPLNVLKCKIHISSEYFIFFARRYVRFTPYYVNMYIVLSSLILKIHFFIGYKNTHI